MTLATFAVYIACSRGKAMAATEQQAAALREQVAEDAAGGRVSVDHCEVLGHF